MNRVVTSEPLHQSVPLKHVKIGDFFVFTDLNNRLRCNGYVTGSEVFTRIYNDDGYVQFVAVGNAHASWRYKETEQAWTGPNPIGTYPVRLLQKGETITITIGE